MEIVIPFNTLDFWCLSSYKIEVKSLAATDAAISVIEFLFQGYVVCGTGDLLCAEFITKYLAGVFRVCAPANEVIWPITTLGIVCKRRQQLEKLFFPSINR